MMRHTCNNPQTDNLIDKYISGSTNAHCNNADDELFARPIEDEDLFSIFPSDTVEKIDDPCLNNFIDSDQENTNNFDTSIVPVNDQQVENDLFDDNFEEEIAGLSGLGPMLTNDKIAVDDIFLDDYSISSDANRFKSGLSYENGGYIENNLEPQAIEAPKLPPQPSPAQIKNRKIKELILQQTQARGLLPKRRLADAVDANGMIEVMGEHTQTKSDHNTKFIFSKLFNKSKKAPESLDDRNKISRELYKQNLRKTICAQKRKIWDSFQAATDVFDEDEELIGEDGDDVNEEHENDDNEQVVDGDDEEMENSGDDEEQIDEDEQQSEDENEMSEDDEAVPRRYRITEEDDDDDEQEEEENDNCNGNFEELEKEDKMILSEAEESGDESDQCYEEEDEQSNHKGHRKVIIESDSDE